MNHEAHEGHEEKPHFSGGTRQKIFVFFVVVCISLRNMGMRNMIILCVLCGFSFLKKQQT
jgi:hypothetical protein